MRWELTQRLNVKGYEVAYEVLGSGPPAVLVHGFPSNAFIWRDVAPRLARNRTVYVYDLPGQGKSGKRADMDVSDPAQARVLRALLDAWRLERPAIVLHDIGCAYGMLAYHFEGCRYERVALVSAAMMNPCVTAATLHAQAHIEAYRTMPYPLYELIASARIRSTTFKPISEEAFEAYLAPWRGPEGQAAWYNRVAQIDPRHIARLESKLGPMEIPARIIWGTEDTWIPPDQARRLQGLISNADIRLIEGGGHFLMEDAPGEVADLLVEFLDPGR